MGSSVSSLPRDLLIRSKSRWTKWPFVLPNWNQISQTSPLLLMKSFSFLFFQKPTESLVHCLGKTFHSKYYGLNNFEKISTCTITTPRFTWLPKSPGSEKSTLVYQTKPIFVFDSKWVKVSVAFDQNNKKVTTPSEPNPWMTINPNHDEDLSLWFIVPLKRILHYPKTRSLQSIRIHL